MSKGDVCLDYVAEYVSPVGKILLSSDGENLTGLWIENQKYFKSTLGDEYEERKIPVIEKAILWLEKYFSGENPEIDFNIKPNGSEFRQTVWKILFRIPYGETITYGEIAKRIEKETGKRVSAQAVGGAVGHNPISIIIPCHRVVGADGGLTGYAGGIDKKEYLLNIERQDKN